MRLLPTPFGKRQVQIKSESPWEADLVHELYENVKTKPESAVSLRESLRTHKVYTKDQCFNLNYYKISVKSYVVAVY